ncbi:[NiFe]-hydrogenase assembly chaperone HybE [Magnetospirillum sp. SS-4]|uniref:[NiFe]-hydrogenase assembly chaperone HybE n=1 Tax=Magnetospirillum sp. SS-4 TaxID=2681465 RepID=UPI00137EFC1F|nr:[NiFe]-hydrogenase assembly chaperone HybE [Magnetospirillum sp. SS-4]CAA7617773.1 Hydrogenase expression/formation protein hupT [Magnetospirillum sp. SS-4]
MADPLLPADQSRIQHLVTVFGRIGEERMKDLGLYNPALQVEAVGFRRWNGWLAGVLVTPWFMNFVMLPADASTSLENAEVGSRRRIDLPKGQVVFVIGEVDDVGPYLSYSIHSPMGQFPDHASASTTAWAAVGPYFLEPGEEPGGECGFGWGVNKGP